MQPDHVRQRGIWGRMAVAIALAVLLGFVAHAMLAAGGRLPRAVVAAGCVLTLLAGLAGCVPLWRRLDDMAREAHTFSWYWGGAAGMGIGALGVIGLTDPRSAYAAGALTLMLFQLAGSGVVWLGWWASRRAR